MSKRYAVDGYKNTRLEVKIIEADSEEEARQIYAKMVKEEQVEVVQYDWRAFESGDCNDPLELKGELKEKQL